MTDPMPSDTEIAAAIVADYFAEAGGSNFWAVEELMELTGTDPERAWRITLQMLESSTDEAFAAYIAAGSLEDLLAWYGELFIERIEQLAPSSPWLVIALRSTYAEQRCSPEIYRRLIPLIARPSGSSGQNTR